ncbi:CHU large protein [Seminavis robusta]|uniref:CHU large protein n=1 Tax=Seminavis robusta TaxID=568900 RepID=A0A9N8HRK0_9STRA|nr:CHU large protein [Seminavis robusta]|eukprot:Sro1082_g239200.1 CHU large protein (1007) ;mRNA; r:17244-20453
MKKGKGRTDVPPKRNDGNEPKPDQAVTDALIKRAELEAVQQARDEEIAIKRSRENAKNEIPTDSSTPSGTRRHLKGNQPPQHEENISTRTTDSERKVLMGIVAEQAGLAAAEHLVELENLKQQAKEPMPAWVDNSQSSAHLPVAFFRNSDPNKSKQAENTADPKDFSDFAIHSNRSDANKQPSSKDILQVTAVGELVTPGEDIIDEDAIRQQAEIDAEERLLANAVQAEVMPTTTPDEQEGEEYPNWQKYTCLAIGFLLLIVAAVVVIAVSVSVSRKKVIITLAPSQAPTTASPSSAPSMAPSFFTNDICRGAHPVQINTAIRDSTSRNTQEESVATCQDIRTNGRGQWFAIKGGDAWLRVHTCGSVTDYDTQLSVYEAGVRTLNEHPCDVAVCVTGNDQHCGDQSYVQWFGQAGSDYFILIHGYRLYTGEFELEILEEKNGLCEGAFNISQPVFREGGGYAIDSSLQGAGLVDPEQLPECDDNSQKPSGIGVWYTYDGQLSPLNIGVTDEFNVAEYEGSCSALVCAASSSAEADTIRYLLVYGNTSMAETSFRLVLSSGRTEPFYFPQENEFCEGASNEADFTLPPNQVGFQDYTPFNFGFNAGGAPSCGDAVWHTSTGFWYAAIGTGRAMTVSTCPNVTAGIPDFEQDIGRDDFLDTQISVYTGSCDMLVCIDGNDQFCRDQSSVSWFTEPGVEYLILVHGYGQRSGYFNVYYEDAKIHNSPTCQEATTISADGTSILGSALPTEGALSIPFCGFGGGEGQESVSGIWYRAVGTGKTWTASTCSSYTDFTARISVYEGADCTYLACLPTSVSEASPCGDQNAVTWTTVPNQIYYFLVHGKSSPVSGDFLFTLEETASNDNCEGTIGPLNVDDGITTFGSTRSATFKENVPTSCDSEGWNTTGRGLFYSLIGTGDNITATTCTAHTNFDMKLTVFIASCSDLQCVPVQSRDCRTGQDNITLIAGTSVTWSSERTELYYLLLQGEDEEFGNFGMELWTSGSEDEEG